MSFRKREDLLESLMKTNPFMNKAKKVINKKVAQYIQPKSNNMEAATTKAMNHQVKEPTNSNIPSKIKTEEALSNKRPAQIQSPLEEAIKDHDAGIKGNKLAVKKAYASLKELAKKQPKNLEIKAYYGSATTLLARDANSVTDKMKYALEGLKQLDEVVETSPDLILARFLRGNVCYRLPELYFQRTSTAIEDFSYLVTAFEGDSSILSEAEYTEVLKNLVEAYKRTNQLEKATDYQGKLKALKHGGHFNEADDNDKVVNSNYEVSNEGLTDEAMEYYQRALYGDADDVKEAMNFFDVFVLTNPSPEVEMIHIDLQSMQGRDSINTYEMFGSAIKSMKAMDSLINEHPSLYELRAIRSRHCLRLPELFFRRAAIAVSDIETLLKAESYLKEAGANTHHQLLFDLGFAYEKLDMLEAAHETWNKLLKLRPSKEIKDSVQEKLSIHSYKEIDLRTLSTVTKEKLYETAKEMHHLGAKGSKVAAKQSLEAWEKAKDAFPDCEIAKTYYAASVALMGKFANDPQEMFGETIKGLKLLKSCIKSDDPELKYLRGCIYMCLPEGFFHTSDKAAKDFKSVKSAYENNRENAPITKEQYVKLLYDLGHLYKKTSFIDKAKKTWKTLLKEDPHSEYARRIAHQVGEEE
ncbi:hypothetical protein [Metabacillus litoralis]|uniref:hypothetical protein n=1 Tax=Metabacillus litoralis TaxID=152268 RepID=UPI0020420BBC|nr:hypothetical protein [Metabacillus litoralis]MCM3163870.1 hypothetical protein [Metabacillus litoralis]